MFQLLSQIGDTSPCLFSLIKFHVFPWYPHNMTCYKKLELIVIYHRFGKFPIVIRYYQPQWMDNHRNGGLTITRLIDHAPEDPRTRGPEDDPPSVFPSFSIAMLNNQRVYPNQIQYVCWFINPFIRSLYPPVPHPWAIVCQHDSHSIPIILNIRSPLYHHYIITKSVLYPHHCWLPPFSKKNRYVR